MTGITVGSGILAAGVINAGVGAYEASQQAGLQGQALDLARTTQGEQQYYNSLLQTLLANPSSVSSLPGFQFELNTGSAAVADQMSASGFGGSGNEAAALTQFGQGLAGQFYLQQAGLLASLSGVTAPSSPAQGVSAATGAAGLTSNTLSSLLNSLNFYGRLGAGNSGAASGTPASGGGGGGWGTPPSGGGGGPTLLG